MIPVSVIFFLLCLVVLVAIVKPLDVLRDRRVCRGAIVERFEASATMGRGPGSVDDLRWIREVNATHADLGLAPITWDGLLVPVPARAASPEALRFRPYEPPSARAGRMSREADRARSLRRVARGATRVTQTTF